MSDFLSQWKNVLGPEVVELPSGLHAQISRAARLENLVASGRIDNTLIEAVQKVKADKQGRVNDTREIQKLVPAINAVVMAVVLDPKITEEGGEDSIPVNDIPLMDRIWIFEQTNKAAINLRPFREEPGQPAEAVSDSEGVPDEAEQDSGDSG